MSIWDTRLRVSVSAFALAAALSALLFLLVVWVFIPLGQEVGPQMNLTPKPLTAYSLNLAASLAGILVFLGASRLMLPPWVWLGIVVLGFALLQRNRTRQILLASLLVPLVLLLHEPSDHDHYSNGRLISRSSSPVIMAQNGEMTSGHGPGESRGLSTYRELIERISGKASKPAEGATGERIPTMWRSALRRPNPQY